MRLHRFFIEESLRNRKDIRIHEDELIHQWKDVFRLRAGDQIILLDNSGFEYICEIVLLARGEAEIKIIDQSAALNMPEKEIWLFAALIKKDNYEWILEKCTELGVSHFVPVVSERTEKKDLNVERAEKIIKEASEQSERGIMPKLHELLDLKAGITYAQENNLTAITFHVAQDAEKFDISKITKQNKLEKALNIPEEKIKLAVFVGPEGGWSDREIELFKEHNIPVYSLGHQVLRAETAAIAITSLVLL